MAKRNTNHQQTENAKNPAIMVITMKAKDGSTTTVDAAQTAIVSAVEVHAAGTTKANLCLNFIAGRVDASITEAISKRGGITRLFGGKIADADVNAMKKIVTHSPEELKNAWARYVLNAKRVRCISLQALAKAANPPATGSSASEEDEDDTPATLRAALAAWCGSHDARKLPADLFDILVKFEIAETDDAPADK